MAAAGIPAKLKTLDITRFAHRASQLEKFKPAISYWCHYYVLQQILAKGMQSADAECTTWTVALMDHVEQIKTEHGTEDAIADDGAAQAYVEQFGLQTFQRADNAITANKVSKQTADTLQAAATFLELLSIWAPPTPDIASKIKYAKYHALRIAKDIRAGKDPNDSNPPPPTETAADDVPALDPNDPDVLQINHAAAALQPSVEDAPDVSPVDAADTAAATTAGISPAPVISPDAAPAAEDASAERPRQGSAGGGYFPQVTPAPAEQPPPQPHPTARDAESFYGGGAAAAAAPPAPAQTPPVQIPTRTAAPAPVPAPAPIPAPVPAPIPAAAPVPAPAPAPAPASLAGQPDDAAVAEAQKHARWAISALNFEDVNTAVKELRLALGKLGAT